MRAQALSAICCGKNADPKKQRHAILECLRTGANINETDKNGVTPLHRAVRFRSPAAARTLIQEGADINQTCTRSGSTPLQRAVTYTGAPGTAGKV